MILISRFSRRNSVLQSTTRWRCVVMEASVFKGLCPPRISGRAIHAFYGPFATCHVQGVAAVKKKKKTGVSNFREFLTSFCTVRFARSAMSRSLKNSSVRQSLLALWLQPGPPLGSIFLVELIFPDPGTLWGTTLLSILSRASTTFRLK